MNYIKIKPQSNMFGFTLVELMITLVISGIILAAIYSAYIVQQRSHTAQDAVAEMQQNLRAAMMIMGRDIRMAGYDPKGTGKYGITSAETAKMVFTADFNDDGGTPGSGETMTYELYPPGSSTKSLRRVAGQGAVADNIQKIEFQYLDGTGAVISYPNANQPARDTIRAVQISILARASRPDRNFTNTMTYVPASGVAWDLNGAADGYAANDQYRRRLLITTIQLRNMGLDDMEVQDG